jgi:hypothetical protein
MEGIYAQVPSVAHRLFCQMKSNGFLTIRCPRLAWQEPNTATGSLSRLIESQAISPSYGKQFLGRDSVAFV